MWSYNLWRSISGKISSRASLGQRDLNYKKKETNSLFKSLLQVRNKIIVTSKKRIMWGYAAKHQNKGFSHKTMTWSILFVHKNLPND